MCTLKKKGSAKKGQQRNRCGLRGKSRSFWRSLEKNWKTN